MGFPSLQYRHRASLTQNLRCYGRVCTAVHEASGDFACRFKGINNDESEIEYNLSLISTLITLSYVFSFLERMERSLQKRKG